jgi:hypothetical protein
MLVECASQTTFLGLPPAKVVSNCDLPGLPNLFLDGMHFTLRFEGWVPLGAAMHAGHDRVLGGHPGVHEHLFLEESSSLQNGVTYW